MAGLAELRARLTQRGTALAEGAYARLPRPLQRTWQLAQRTVRDSLEDRVPGLAAETALYALISLPALLLVVLGSLGFVADALGPGGSAELRRLVFDVPRTFLAADTYDSYARVAETVLQQGRGDVVTIGVPVALWTGSRAMHRCLQTITIAYDLPPRPGWRRRLLALGLTVGSLLLAVVVLPPLVLGPQLVGWVLPGAVATATLEALSLLYWPALAVLVLGLLTTLFHVGAPWGTPWRRDLPGAVLALVLWLLAAAGLRAYLALSGGEEAVYAQLGTPIAVVLWFYVSAIVLLVGAELNAEIEKMWPTRRAEEPTPAATS